MTYREKKYRSTKTYRQIAPCAYRQWRADSHCNQIHGYAFSFHFEFETDDLDARNWAFDYGGLRPLKDKLEEWFDHTYWLLRTILCVMNYCAWVNSVLLKLLRSKRPDVKDWQTSYTNISIRYSSLHVERQRLIDSGAVVLKYVKLIPTWQCG